MSHSDQPKIPIYSLIKFFPCLEFAEAFQRGQLYFQPLENFRRWEDEGVRGDRFEGSSIYFADHSQLTITFAGHVLKDIVGSPTLAYHDILHSHTFCMFAIHAGKWSQGIPAEEFEEFRESLRIDERVAAFGEHAVVVMNPKRFISRMDAIANSIMPRQFKRGLIEYFDEETFTGWHDPDKFGFHKRSQYSYQKEYRIMLDLGPHAACPDPRIVEIGDISDITVILPSHRLNERFEIRPPESP